MSKIKKLLLTIAMSVVAALTLCLGVVFSIPTKDASAASLATTNWTLAIEGTDKFRVQNGNTYWSANTSYATTESILAYSEINGKTLSEINAEKPGAITVTLQPADGIGSFYRVNINTEIAGFTTVDIATFVVKSGWSHTDSSGTYTIDTNLYFAHEHNKWGSDTDSWKYIPAENVVDVSDVLAVQDQGTLYQNACTILFKTTNQKTWTTSPATPNEGGGAFLNTLFINGTSVREWNKRAEAMLANGEITDITFGAEQGNIKNGVPYAPIFGLNAYVDGIGSYMQVTVPVGYIADISSFKVGKGFANLQGDTLYYMSKDVEYVKSGSQFVKVASTVDISDAFKIIAQDRTASDGTMLYYLHTNNVKYWTEQYGSTGAYAINEKEWKGQADVSLQGGAVQMSYIEFNGTPLYDINASDNGSYGATQGNIASGSKYAPILAFLTPAELGDSIKVQIPSKYPSNSGTAADNHKTIAIKKGFYVVDTTTNIKYEVTKDIQWDYEDGEWVEHTNKIETSVLEATMFGSASDAFAGIKLADSNYEIAPSTYAGDVKTAKSFAQSANFISHILIDDTPLRTPSEAFLNVWGNKGYFSFRPGNNTATKITILAGCQFPTYKALLTGEKEVYVTTEDITFVKDGNTWVKDEGSCNVVFTVDGATYATQKVERGGYATVPATPTKASTEMYDYKFAGWYLNGVEYDFSTPVNQSITLNAVFTQHLREGEYKTSVKGITYARDKATNWMMFSLTEKDYPKASETYNVKVDEAKVAALNLYDKIIVDGFTLRNRINSYGAAKDKPTINLWVADCFALQIPGCTGALDGAKKVTIKAGAQFPSYTYATEGKEVYYLTQEEITFVNVGNNNGAWERQYRATFKADGNVVDIVEYVESQGFTAPEVPEKDGYRGVWESYTAKGDIVINAVYTQKPAVLGKTGIAELRNMDKNNAILVIKPSNSDYPASVEGSWNLGLDVSHLQKFNLLDYVTVNGKTLREIGVTGMAINKFTRAGLGLDTTLSDSMEIVIKKGCEIPSYEYWKNPNGATSCYVVDADYIGVYNAEGENKFVISSENADLEIPAYDNYYVLSDLAKMGYGKTNPFKDGMEVLTNSEFEPKDDARSEATYRYGYVEPGESFLLTFDFKFEGASYYHSLNVQLGVEGHGGNKYHFGWRLYLIRGSDETGITPNFCVEYFTHTGANADVHHNIPNSGNTVLGGQALEEGKVYTITIGYRLLDAATGEVEIFTALNAFSRTDTYVMGGDFVKFAPYLNSLTMNANLKGNDDGKITVCDPGKMPAVESGLEKVQLFSDDTLISETNESSIVLPNLNPVEYNKAGCVLVGWTTDIAGRTDLYPVGYEMNLTDTTALYAVWMRFALRDGAGVRIKSGSSGIRFTTEVDGAAYGVGVDKGLILEIGTLVTPTEYLKFMTFTHEGLGNGYYVERKTENWHDTTSAMHVYTAAFVNISYDQYGRAFSARGYMKINYTSGAGYVYTAYDAENHSRSIYQVATMAYSDYEGKTGFDVLQGYVSNIVDLIIDMGGNVNKDPQAMGGYELSNIAKDGEEVTITLNSPVKAATLNGTPLVMGYAVKVLVGTNEYLIENYTLSTNGLTITFDIDLTTPEKQLGNAYYYNLIEAYGKRDDYNKENKALVDQILAISREGDLWEEEGEGWDAYDYLLNYAIDDSYGLAHVKTASEMASNRTSKTTLTAPVLTAGLGYTVTWNKVANADYYYVYDSNDNDAYTVVMAEDDKATYSYEVEVVGNHNVYVVAHSYFTAYNSSPASNVMATPEVKPVFSYKSMSDGLYKFDETQMGTMGIDKNGGYYYDTTDKRFFAYYNKDIGWTPYPSMATDWTSPTEFPAHAQRLKDMGNNIIMIAHDTTAMYADDEISFESSRLKFIMDTAWSMGMKVLVCDEVFYAFSMSDGSDSAATSKAQVTSAINSRVGFAEYVTHPAFYGFSLDDEPYGNHISAMSYTISALDEACKNLGVSDPFYLACLFQAQGGSSDIETYMTQGSLKSYYDKWLAIDGVDGEYLYVDIYTQHAMGQPTDRYNTSFEVIYSDSYLGGKYDFHQAITAHTQNTDYLITEKQGVLLEQDMYMSLLYAAAHNVAGYSWFCYFPISGELSGSMVGFDGNGYGNGIGNKASGCYYNAAKTAGYQYELIQGWLNGYEWKTRKLSNSDNLLTTTLSNGTKTATMYVNADVDSMSASVKVTVSGSVCYLIGCGVGTAEQPYQVVSGSVTLAPGQAVLCLQ